MKDYEVDEYWKPVIGYEDCYEVSNKGEVKSLSGKQDGKCRKEKILKPVKNEGGYLRVYLSRGGKSAWRGIHRLVIEVFEGVSKDQVKHLDGDRTNNNYENLAYITKKQKHKESQDCYQKSFFDDEALPF